MVLYLIGILIFVASLVMLVRYAIKQNEKGEIVTFSDWIIFTMFSPLIPLLIGLYGLVLKIINM
jgi:hypothetical protein